jgi:hypothetical protein
MSGYLQRLASQAVKPQANVRPLVNPFTAPAAATVRLQPLDDGPLEETVYTSIDQSKRIPKGTETPPGMSGPESNKSVTQNVRDRVVRESEDRSPFQPLLSAAEELSPARPDHAAKAPPLGQESSREESNSDNALHGGSLEIVVAEGAQARAGRDLTRGSIVRRQTPRGEGAVREVLPHEVRILEPSPAGRADTPHLPRKSMAASRGADEIQINIGRIEVTAMPQAAPRPTPPVRKSINLDEYLKPRHGRNG